MRGLIFLFFAGGWRVLDLLEADVELSVDLVIVGMVLPGEFDRRP